MVKLFRQRNGIRTRYYFGSKDGRIPWTLLELISVVQQMLRLGLSQSQTDGKIFIQTRHIKIRQDFYRKYHQPHLNWQVRPQHNFSYYIYARFLSSCIYSCHCISRLISPRRRYNPVKFLPMECGQVPSGAGRTHFMMQYYAYILMFVGL